MHSTFRTTQAGTTKRIDALNALLCAAAVAIAFCIVNPFARMPFDDDWSYAFTVRELLRTGRMVYNGWSAPLILTNVWWGALFAKIFGYNFVVLRFTTLPLAIGCAILAYLLARRAEISPGRSIFVSLLLCISPIFLPLADSFMTDVPALFFTMLCLYAFVRADESLVWLVVGILSGIIGGMGRQTVWVVPLCILPYLIWIHRHRRGLVLIAVAGLLVVVLDIVLSLRWFDRQPWVYLDPPLLSCIRLGLRKPDYWRDNLLKVFLTLMMLILPVALAPAGWLLARLWRLRKTWRGAVTAVVLLLLSAWIIVRSALGIAPWVLNIVTAHGVIGSLELSGHRPLSLPLSVLGVISALVLLCCFILLARGAELLVEPPRLLGELRQLLTHRLPVYPILAIFAFAYFCLMIVRSAQDIVFDRYMLPLIPCAVIALVRFRRPGLLGWTLLAIYMAYGVASTQDNLALAAARRQAVSRLESAGVPSNKIAAGFEYDFYTQLEKAGHINRYGITNPPNSFIETEGYVPALKCRYRIEWSPDVDTMPTRFGTIEYISWLPPFHRRIFIDEFRHPWWLNPESKKLPPMDYEMYYY